MTNIQILINELKDMKVLYDKGFMSEAEFSRIKAAINHEIEMEVMK
ncbi:hypothetical protein BCPG3_040 [Bacillus phage BCPG3]|uniref:SHOCT domain-containing protein n=1 Tax=Bacillus phage SalinJah TaxID=1837830 RepID=A0A173GBR0_9CAUD|nr:hypothetical protein SALINJAH_57 [Bacillus phage SalinJah]ANH50700.1 hypothetical protein SALINJAH_57 [Bacillus phage SalinJah]QQO38963.1 hypothetical protein BCPG1_232 [Bacillus phage BCPG1]QSJ04357.1 hypothetical protein BCPG3_040 [Bacillus phage BCPG3]QSJ04570.1 hypothetical protein BCP18_038 [Bacillus phage BCP18]